MRNLDMAGARYGGCLTIDLQPEPARFRWRVGAGRRHACVRILKSFEAH